MTISSGASSTTHVAPAVRGPRSAACSESASRPRNSASTRRAPSRGRPTSARTRSARSLGRASTHNGSATLTSAPRTCCSPSSSRTTHWPGTVLADLEATPAAVEQAIDRLAARGSPSSGDDRRVGSRQARARSGATRGPPPRASLSRRRASSPRARGGRGRHRVTRPARSRRDADAASRCAGRQTRPGRRRARVASDPAAGPPSPTPLTMPEAGLEPAIPFGRWFLKPLRIPFRHSGDPRIIVKHCPGVAVAGLGYPGRPHGQSHRWDPDRRRRLPRVERRHPRGDPALARPRLRGGRRAARMARHDRGRVPAARLAVDLGDPAARRNDPAHLAHESLQGRGRTRARPPSPARARRARGDRRRGHARRRGTAARRGGSSRRGRAEDDRQRPVGDRLHVRVRHRRRDRDRGDRSPAHHRGESRPRDGDRGHGPPRRVDRRARRHRGRRRCDPDSRAAGRRRELLRPDRAPARAGQGLLDRGRRRGVCAAWWTIFPRPRSTSSATRASAASASASRGRSRIARATRRA